LPARLDSVWILSINKNHLVLSDDFDQQHSSSKQQKTSISLQPAGMLNNNQTTAMWMLPSGMAPGFANASE
jgi:hypothetical protein